ncbi:MAG: hypothetical protein GY898_33530 [Proteobacteria bacterium]|nr:hypothetical protein [Pseudomonadota bacterium]
MLLLLAVIGIVGFSLLNDVEKQRFRDRRRTWEKAAGVLGLGFQRGRGTAIGTMKGIMAERRVRLSHEAAPDNGAKVIVLAVKLRDSIPDDLRLETESLGSGIASMVGRGDFAVGDPAFDKRFLLGGLSEELSAIFSAKARQALTAEEAMPGPRIQDGWLILTRPARLDTVDALLKFARHGLADAAHLDRFDDVVTRLIHNARHDPVPGVRQTAMGQLARNYPARPEVQALAADLANRPERSERLIAMTLLRHDERAFAIARSIGFETSSASAAEIEQALTWLADTGPHPVDRAPLLRRATSSGPVPVRLAALRGLGAVGRIEEIEVLFELQSDKGALGEAALEAAEQIRSRLGLGGDAGRLSVSATGDEEGRLSAAAAAGSLAISKKG